MLMIDEQCQNVFRNTSFQYLTNRYFKPIFLPSRMCHEGLPSVIESMLLDGVIAFVPCDAEQQRSRHDFVTPCRLQ